MRRCLVPRARRESGVVHAGDGRVLPRGSGRPRARSRCAGATRRSSVSMPCSSWKALNAESDGPEVVDVLGLDERDVRRARAAEPVDEAAARTLARYGSVSCGQRAGSAAKSNVPRSTTTPPSDVPCPPRNFVAECTTMSAPWSFARCRYGVATVASITSGTPAACAMSATARTSSTCAMGFVTDSANSARVVGRMAAAHASRSSWSTNVTSMPQSANVSCSRSTVPP